MNLSYISKSVPMVRITHKPKFPSLFKRAEPWFERSFFPFSRTSHPWFRMDPLVELESSLGDYLDYMDRYFSELPEPLQKFTRNITCDMDDQGDKFVITADLPGMEKDEVNINVLDSQIEISAEHKESKDEKDKDYVRRERSHVKYYRSLELPEEIIGTKVQAKMTNGILTVEMPKKTPTKVEKPLTVKVQ